MRDPFAVAAGALFRAPGSAAAVYQPEGGAAAYPIRVVRTDADVVAERGRGRAVQSSLRFELPRDTVPTPRAGELFAVGGAVIDGAIVGGEVFAIFGDPMLDAEGTTWVVGAERFS